MAGGQHFGEHVSGAVFVHPAVERQIGDQTRPTVRIRQPVLQGDRRQRQSVRLGYAVVSSPPAGAGGDGGFTPTINSSKEQPKRS